MKARLLSLFAVAALIAVLPAGNALAAITSANWDQETFTSPPYLPPDTNVTIDLNPAGDTATIGIATPYAPGADPIFKFFFTDGVAGTLLLNETVTNVGPTPWTDWDEIMLGFTCPLTGSCWGVGATPVPQVGSALWDLGSASVGGAGAGGTFLNYGFYVDIDGDGVAETLTDYLELDFATAILTGQTFTVSKLISYGAGLDYIVVAEFPTVPLPAALPLLLTGLAALGFVGRKSKRATAVSC